MTPHGRASGSSDKGGVVKAPADLQGPEDLPPKFDRFSAEGKQAAFDALTGCRAGGGAAAGEEDCEALALAAAKRAEGQPLGEGGERRA